jgi:hypothetical protein
MHRHVPNLSSLAGDAQVRHALAALDITQP